MIEKTIMPTMNISNSKTSISNIYWEMLKDLSSDIKLELIAKLSASLVAKDNTSDTSIGLQNLSGDGKMIVRQMRLSRIYVVQGLQIGRLNYETISS